MLGRLATSLDGPPYNLVLHTAPLHEQVDATYHWHWEIHPRLREIAGLELGTGLPVNPVSPEDAVEELRSGWSPGHCRSTPHDEARGGQPCVTRASERPVSASWSASLPIGAPARSPAPEPPWSQIQPSSSAAFSPWGSP